MLDRLRLRAAAYREKEQSDKADSNDDQNHQS